MRVGFCVASLKNTNAIRGVGVYSKNLLENLHDVKDLEVVEFEDINTLENVDLVHYPFFDLFFKTLPVRKKFPTVVTIHDVTPLVFPKNYPSGIKGYLNLQYQKLSLKSVKAVITDSEASKKDIQKYLNVPAQKIRAVYLGWSDSYKLISNKKELEDANKKYNLPQKFALFVGNVNWNKNIVNLTQAVLNADLEIVLTGKAFEEKGNLDHPEQKSHKQFIEKFGNDPRVHVLGFVNTEDLVKIYNLAQVFLFPSFYEGFGIPILEAQACGVPVITSNVSSLPEVAGDSAMQVDPYKTEEIRDAVKKLLEDNNLRQTLIKKGFENIKRFSWKKCAEMTTKVYKEVDNQ